MEKHLSLLPITASLAPVTFGAHLILEKTVIQTQLPAPCLSRCLTASQPRLELLIWSLKQHLTPVSANYLGHACTEEWPTSRSRQDNHLLCSSGSKPLNAQIELSNIFRYNTSWEVQAKSPFPKITWQMHRIFDKVVSATKGSWREGGSGGISPKVVLNGSPSAVGVIAVERMRLLPP